ncbi:hypothetical protein PV682_13255 [Streptomyces niveiscabiei]|uniref:HEAT repeat domain-containing protein n=1 Tax=Streptomyces niveiscabiei TaxID=164115 RepID=UPI0029AB8A4F|nr:HEAT repeat domain-containing protein [Streptomyces niveiscabiei]MDX3382422.1 hypothetical protein [Streptomyces niveiscabiei]
MDLCTAIAAYDDTAAERLMYDDGADPDELLPDGTTPLSRAVDSGSPSLVLTLLGKDPCLRLPQPDRARLLASARRWYETGAEEELRRRTGESGPSESVRVLDDEYDWVEEIRLGEHVVRAGHGAVLTLLERAFLILTPVDELVARAAAVADEGHVDWTAVDWHLCNRPSLETWSALAAHHRHPDPVHRRFVAHHLWSRGISGRGPVPETLALLTTWAAQEVDPGILAEVVKAFGQYTDPNHGLMALSYADHPDVRVRRAVPDVLADYGGAPLTPGAATALRALMRDPDALVRACACAASAGDSGLLAARTEALVLLAEGPDTDMHGTAAEQLGSIEDTCPAVIDALWSLLGDDDVIVRLEAAYGLLRHGDPRIAEAVERVGPLGEGFEDDHRRSALRRWGC